jgi:hypothetical protein
MTPTKTLNETVELMLSDDPVDRFKAEYYQLENRFIALDEYLMNWDLGRLDPAPQVSRFLYSEQLGHMRNYLIAMKKRADAEGITL